MSQDIVERLRSLATIADAYSPEAYKEAADTIESLRARVAELEAEADPEALHIAYLHGQADRNQQLAAKDQRIAELEAENELLENKVMARDAELWGRTQEILSCKDQLAAKALTIKTMRTVLENFIDSHEECTDFDGFTAQIVSIDDYHEAQEALALPDNSTEILQEWRDKQFGEPVVEAIQEPGSAVRWWWSDEGLALPKGTFLYRKPEIK